MNKEEREKERKKERVVWVIKNLYVNKDGEREKGVSKEKRKELDCRISINVLSETVQYDYLCSRVS
jgi:hypothetical protein